MRMSIAVLRSRGRLVLPAEVRGQLGLSEGDAVLFLIDGDQVRLTRSPENFGEYLALYGPQPAWNDEPEAAADSEGSGG